MHTSKANEHGRKEAGTNGNSDLDRRDRSGLRYHHWRHGQEPAQCTPAVMTTGKDGGERRMWKWDGNRTLLMIKVSILTNAAMATFKLIFGIASFSLFLVINSLYNFGIATAKYNAVLGIASHKTKSEQHRDCATIGVILLVSSLLYIAYSIRMFVAPPKTQYSLNVALAIATFTFVELPVTIRGAIKTKKRKTPLLHAVRLVNLAGAFICLALTQTAIMSVSQKNFDPSFVNGLAGITFGAVATGISLYLIFAHQRFSGGKFVETFLLEDGAGKK